MILFDYILYPQLIGVTVTGGFKLLLSYTINAAQVIYFSNTFGPVS